MDRDRAQKAIRDFLVALGVDPASQPFADTPERVADAWIDELLEGYNVDVPKLLAGNVIAREARTPHEVVVVRDIPITTMCPHHLMPGLGTAVVAFEPKENVVGVGAVAKAAQALARRLALQETTGELMARALYDAVKPAWAACRMILSHTCMTARGERAHGARLETVAVVGDGDRAAMERAVGLGT